MEITFDISQSVDGLSITLTNVSVGYTPADGSAMLFTLSGTINGDLVAYIFSPAERTAFLAGTPLVLVLATISEAKVTILPDDFFRAKIVEKVNTAIVCESLLSSLSTISSIQNSIHNKIVHTNRILSEQAWHNIHGMVIHLEALEILGPNPPISMEDTVVNRIKYLKTL